MRYVGGKTRIAKWVEDSIVPIIGGRTNYIEPFLGSGAVLARMVKHFSWSLATDAHPDLIMMWQAIKAGWDPPEHVTKEQYQELKNAPSSAIRGFVGFGASFSGKWFGGYVDTVWDAHHKHQTKPYLVAARNSLLAMVPVLKNTHIACGDYSQIRVNANCVIYCDPPYAGTLGYAPGAFDHDRFWRTCETWASSGAVVVVSEQRAPEGWGVLASRERKAMLRVAKGGENNRRTENLYQVHS